MTGATGDLTPDDTNEAFVPGERREIEDAGTPLATTREPADVSDPAAEKGRPPRRIGGDELSGGEDRF